MYFKVKMAETGRKNIFIDRETTNKVLLKIFRCWQVKEKLAFMFSKPIESMKGQC